MKVFVSWSGSRSHAVALAFKRFLEGTVQYVGAFVSSEDIAKGTRPFSELASQLEESDFGIVVLTKENIGAPWLYFESGAIAKSQADGRVVPLLVDLDRAELKGPLSQFQNSLISKDDVWMLLQSIDTANRDNPLGESRLRDAFELWWPRLDALVEKALAETENSNSDYSPRSDRDILEEMLELVRDMRRDLTESQKREFQSVLVSSFLSNLAKASKRGDSDLKHHQYIKLSDDISSHPSSAFFPSEHTDLLLRMETSPLAVREYLDLMRRSVEGADQGNSKTDGASPSSEDKHSDSSSTE